ncbi:LuxR family transcriptional regulator [Streptomyces gobiensis]|uniref:LuxR family transcriptional regulator n=1 Tax=Streptomyces gobiensis TaxID=2875706 RepID=UPI001E3F36AC|nr:LuxR family transcriptional regulator [Streptomyces gobiensis]UGY94186.1 LuxR family transcriptional regulator [Streptomyces gobiensis]
MERSLREIRSLLDSTIALHRQRAARETRTAVIRTDPDRIGEASARLIQQAETSISLAMSSEVGGAEEIFAALHSHLPVHGGRMHVRLLCPSSMQDMVLAQRYSKEGKALFDVQVARVSMLHAAIIDGKVGLVCTGSFDGRRASVIQSSVVIHGMHTLFDEAWKNAQVLADQEVSGNLRRQMYTRQVLESLSSGDTDEVAARKLDMSVRTYRRYVAEILRELGARTRFEAGALAAQLRKSSATTIAPAGTPMTGGRVQVASGTDGFLVAEGERRVRRDSYVPTAAGCAGRRGSHRGAG